MRILQVEAHVILGDPHQAGEQAELLATLAQDRRTGAHPGEEVVRAAILQAAAVEVEIIDPAIELQRAPSALAERLEHLGAIPRAILVATGFAGEVITELGIAAPEAGIAGGNEHRRGAEQVERVRAGGERVAAAIGIGHNILAFGGDVERLEDAGEFEPEDIVALGREEVGVDEALVGQLGERTRPIAYALVGRWLAARLGIDRGTVVRLEIAVLVIGTEVQLVGAHQRRVSRPRRADPAVIVDAAIDGVGGENTGVEAERVGLVHVAAGQADAARVDERIVERRALDERQEARAGDLFEPVQCLMVADGEIERLAQRRISDDDIAEADAGIGEIGLEFVAEAARDGALGAKPNAAGAGVEAEVAGDDVILGIADEADVIIEPPARLERPAGFLVLEQRRALPRRSGLDHRRLDTFECFLESFDLGLEQFDLRLQLVDRLRFGDRRVGGGVRSIGLGRLRLRRRILRKGGTGHGEGAAAQQRRVDGLAKHSNPFPPISDVRSVASASPADARVHDDRWYYFRLARLSGAKLRAACWLRARILFGAATRPPCLR